jgi:hypothetical protein
MPGQGMEDFTHQWELEKSAEQARRDMGTNLPPRLSRWGYRMITQDDSTMAFERTYAPWYVVVLAVLLFPIGLLFLLRKRAIGLLFLLIRKRIVLLFLLIRKRASLVFTIEPDGQTSKMTANGRATPKLRNALIRAYPPNAARPVDANVGPA